MDKGLSITIKAFMDEILVSYPELFMQINEDKCDDSILIYHNYAAEDTDEKFMQKEIDLIDKYFWKNQIFSIGFSYGYELSESIKDKTIIDYTRTGLSNIIYLQNYMKKGTEIANCTFTDADYDIAAA